MVRPESAAVVSADPAPTMAPRNQAPLGQLLLEDGAVDPGNLLKASVMRGRQDSRLGQILLAAVCSGEAFSDLLLALFDGIHQRRPDLGRDDPDQTSEGQRLRKKGEIDIHG